MESAGIRKRTKLSKVKKRNLVVFVTIYMNPDHQRPQHLYGRETRKLTEDRGHVSITPSGESGQGRSSGWRRRGSPAMSRTARGRTRVPFLPWGRIGVCDSVLQVLPRLYMHLQVSWARSLQQDHVIVQELRISRCRVRGSTCIPLAEPGNTWVAVAKYSLRHCYSHIKHV